MEETSLQILQSPTVSTKMSASRLRNARPADVVTSDE